LLCKKVRKKYEAVPEDSRESLKLQGMRGAKPRWGLALAYYLTQYDTLCGEQKSCCDGYSP
jgi:hypothetical protein